MTLYRVIYITTNRSMGDTKELSDYSSAELGIFIIRLKQEQIGGEKNEHLIVIAQELYRNKLKEERDKSISNEEVKTRINKWIKYLEEEISKVEDISNLVTITIINDKDERYFAIDSNVDPKLCSLTKYCLRRSGYRVYIGNIICAYPNIEIDTKIEENKTYKDYIGQYRRSFDKETLSKAEKAFKRDCSIEKAEQKTREWSSKLEKVEENIYPDNQKENLICIIGNSDGKKQIYRLPDMSFIAGKIVWYFHVLKYELIMCMRLIDPLFDDEI